MALLRRVRVGGALFALALACHAPHRTADTLADLARASSGDERIDVVAKQCALIASCAHPHDSPHVRDPGACVDDWLEHLSSPADPLPACLSTAASCADVTACLHGPENERAVTFCADHPGVASRCDGDALITCSRDDPSESTVTSCAPLGATCGESRTAGGLVTTGCLLPAQCPPDVTRVRCDGDAAVLACHDGILERASCRPGTACHSHTDLDGDEAATCEGPSEVACDTPGKRTCRGSSLALCEPHGHHAHEVTVDCGALGLGCHDVAGRAECASVDHACAPSASRCEWGALVFCAAGKTERVSCGDLGLGRCEKEARGPVALCGAGQPKRTKR